MTKTTSLLIMIHCDQFTGYAVETLEKVFCDAAKLAGYNADNIFWSYPKVIEKNSQIVECQFQHGRNYPELKKFIVQHNIQQVIAFDLGFPADVIPVLYSSGVKDIISYWGASMSSINSGIKLIYKKITWLLPTKKPHFFIFESEAMRLTATHGRGIPRKRTTVIPLGVDTDRFFPAYQISHYAHETLDILKNRKIIFYSGHMEERKGVRVIINAAVELIEKRGQKNIHFVICGNKKNEADVYKKLLANTITEQYVTFAGYRSDIAELMRSASLGVIASTGWDSFTMSSVEMMSSGLPLVVSNLQGLGETIEHNINGFHITPGNHYELAHYILKLTTDEQLAASFSKASRARAEHYFSRNVQIKSIAEILLRTI